MAESAPTVGNDITLWLDVGPEGAPDIQQVTGQRDYTHDSSRDGIDASHKGSDHAVTIPGRESGTISVTLIVQKPGGADSTHAVLLNAYENRLPVFVQEDTTFPGAAVDRSENEIKEGRGYILTFTKNGPDNDLATWDCEITLTERLVAA